MRKIFILMLLILLSCAKHKDFPTALEINQPPTPTNFVVEMPDSGNYFLSWSVGDSAAVSYFQLYIFDPFLGPDKWDTTTAKSYHIDFRPLLLVGIIWGVSTISVDNLESSIVYASAPSP